MHHPTQRCLAKEKRDVPSHTTPPTFMFHVPYLPAMSSPFISQVKVSLTVSQPCFSPPCVDVASDVSIRPKWQRLQHLVHIGRRSRLTALVAARNGLVRRTENDDRRQGKHPADRRTRVPPATSSCYQCDTGSTTEGEKKEVRSTTNRKHSKLLSSQSFPARLTVPKGRGSHHLWRQKGA